jgi:hypothetical protein
MAARNRHLDRIKLVELGSDGGWRPAATDARLTIAIGCGGSITNLGLFDV